MIHTASQLWFVMILVYSLWFTLVRWFTWFPLVPIGLHFLQWLVPVSVTGQNWLVRASIGCNGHWFLFLGNFLKLAFANWRMFPKRAISQLGSRHLGNFLKLAFANWRMFPKRAISQLGSRHLGNFLKLAFANWRMFPKRAIRNSNPFGKLLNFAFANWRMFPKRAIAFGEQDAVSKSGFWGTGGS